MPPRPRRSVAAVPQDADPEFLALSARQRKAIDRAFERGIAGSSKRAGKRRKLDDGRAVAVLVDEVGAGDEDDGFMVGDDGGGFVDDDDGGGFIEGDASPPLEKEDELGPAASTRIALSDLPRILASLGLPNDDDVLGVFRASASGWDEDEQTARQRKRADEAELGVEQKDFRAVCAALMGPDSGGDEGSGSDNEEEDAYQLPLDESSLSSLSELDYDGGPPKVKRAGSPKTRAKRSRKALEVDSERAKLNSRQKEVVRDIWAMLKPKIKDGGGGRGSNILGREEVKHWVRTLGEMWTEEELADMVGLFSSQHEGRGLSFDDFAHVMLRAGLV